MKKIITLILVALSLNVRLQAQKLPLFDDPKMLAMVDRGGDYMYNEQFDSASMVIDQIDKKLSGHPIIYMMRAMNYAWQDQPIRTTSPIFEKHIAELDKTVAAAEKLREKDPNNLEALFFEMSVHGLKAEYYAREGSYMKAVSEAQKTYSSLKLTLDQTDKSPEFYFLAGLYNYFREKYPERHPIYKPFLWFYRSGDKSRGLVQLDSAVRYSKIVKIEAGIYLSYIYLRYEEKPHVALKYLGDMHRQYPNNAYIKAKYVECLVSDKKYEQALPLIQNMVETSRPYYQLCGYTYQAIYFEKVLKSPLQAKKYYEMALDKSTESPNRGEYYRSLIYLGMGRLLADAGEVQGAREYFKKAIDLDESPKVNAEAQQRLDKLKKS